MTTPPTSSAPGSRRTSVLGTIRFWFDAGAAGRPASASVRPGKRVEWMRVLPFAAMHLICLGVFVVGWHPGAVAVAAGLYVVRMAKTK